MFSNLFLDTGCHSTRLRGKMPLEKQQPHSRPGSTSTRRTLTPPRGKRSCWQSSPRWPSLRWVTTLNITWVIPQDSLRWVKSWHLLMWVISLTHVSRNTLTCVISVNNLNNVTTLTQVSNITTFTLSGEYCQNTHSGE